MNIKSISNPSFYLDSLPDVKNTDRKERLRFIEIKANDRHIFAWLNQLRVAPYSYDFIDNRFRKSPPYIINNLPPIKINTHFLLAFHVHAFEENSFLVGRFCEPINAPVNLYIEGLFIEYRLLRKGNKTQLWCKVLGFVKKDASSKMFFLIFSIINRIMMAKQLKTIMKLSEMLASGKIDNKRYNFKDHYPKSGLHWWLFCRRHDCKGLLTKIHMY